MSRIVGIDYGRKRIGIALSDPSGKLALPLCTVDGKIDAVCQALASRKKEISEIVVGLPLLLNGQEGDMAKEVRGFGQKLEAALQIQVTFIDERLTSKMAEQGLREFDMTRKERTKRMDSGAAALLLQTYLDRRNIS